MSVAANRYARALIDVLYPSRAETGLNQLEALAKLLSQEADARRVFENPTISAEKRKALLREIGNALNLDAPIRNFLNLLIERNRMELFDQIVVAYRALLDDKLGVVGARVTSAQPLNPAQQQEVADKLQALTGKRVRMEMVTDPALIGGIVAQVGGTIYDGSIRQQLRTFRSRLASE